MRLRIYLAALVAAGLAAFVASSMAAPSAARKRAPARPAVTKISPSTIVSGRLLTLTGRNFARGRRRNRVVFLGAAGRRDDVTLKATAKRSRKLTVRTRSGLPSGRLKVMNSHGASRPSKGRVTFDDDRDGLSNERERKLGTNPLDPDTDHDGIPDGKDSDPLHPPQGPPQPPTEPPVPDCPVVAATGTGSGPTSSFAGIENVIQEGRSLIAHTAVAGTGRYCLYRKRRGMADTDYQLVGNSTGAGAIRDGQRPAKREDYTFRTDAAKSDGTVALGANTVDARGAGAIGNVNGWAQINETCTECGRASVSAGLLKVVAAGDGTAGRDVGEVAVYNRRLQLASGGEWLARAIPPDPPDDEAHYRSTNLTISDQHPATARSATTVADVTRSGGSFINVGLVAQNDATHDPEWHVVVTDNNGSVTSANIGHSNNVYLVVSPHADGTYSAGFASDTNPGGDIVVNRPIPGGMTSAWYSLRAETNSDEPSDFTAEFMEVWATGQPDVDMNENFEGIGQDVQGPPGFEAQEVAAGLTSPTAVEFAPNGDMFVTERGGIVKRRPAAGGPLGTVLDLSDEVSAKLFADQGLLGFALDPGFVGNGGPNDYGYFYYTTEQSTDSAHFDETTRTVSRVERIKWIGSSFDTGDRHLLVGGDVAAPGTGDTCPPSVTSDCLPADAYTHTAGGLAFGQDGKLWISTPDGADPDPGNGDPLALRSQNVNSLAGKLLRVEPATGEGVVTNPHYDGTSTATKRSPASRIIARGFRNPLRLAQRPDGTHSWYLADVGWNTWEEIDRVPLGAAPETHNYGWPCREGPDAVAASNFSGAPACASPTGIQPPLHYYSSSAVDHAVIGGAFYTGTTWPAPWKPPAGGAAFYYTDYPSGDVTRLDTNATDAVTGTDVFATGFKFPVEVAEGPSDLASPVAGDTAIYVVDLGDVTNPSGTDGKVWRIVQTGP